LDHPSLYVHFPLCEAKCTYCDFYSLPGQDQDSDRILRALLLEAEQRAPRRPRSVFLGGGTPTFHSARELVRFFDRLDELTDFRSSADEVTVECNPESLDPQKAEALLESGATRLSIGVQSLRSEVLDRFGRVHSVEQSLAAVENAQSAGFTRISTDLIYAVPGQSLEQWCEDLERILDLGLEHLSAYNLTFEPGTALERQRRAGQVPANDEEVELAMFWATRERAAAAGLPAYEISNFARAEAACLHNLHYWRGSDYVGIGASAVSRHGAQRWGNTRNLGRWLAAVESGQDPADWREQLGPAGRLAEAWWLGLRLTEGVEPSTARERAQWMAPEDPALDLAVRLASEGLIERRADRFVLTDRGLPLADAVAREFIRWSEDAER
jgi:oxygen-independent coproporphyrinogen-3 oxidase